MCVACSIIGLVAMNNYTRSRAAESRANAERIDALKALAEMERDRASVERLVMLGQLTAGVAHEINNPLAAVIANVGSARAQVQLAGPMDGEVAETFRDVEDGLARIRQIARDLKSLAREEALDEQGECRPSDAVTEAIRLSSFREPVSVRVENLVPVDCGWVEISRGRLVQILLNLLINSADALAECGAATGEVRIAAERVEPALVRLTIEDSGPGIPAEILPKLFDPFFTTKPPGKGTGLGLALCRQYVEGACGTIWAENSRHGGARFVLELPAAKAVLP
ncbi:MAG: hypothetical protein HY901_17725 [Deltaproteobacteria bacterium]|nr:hypothetical protein [Deltaproteobacteria bacterium]